MEHVHAPAREIPIRTKVEVLVCGAGPAGMLAAYAAAVQGAKTCLVEKHGFVGGTNTAGLVCGVGGWQYDLDGRPLIAGRALEVMRRLAAAGGADPELVGRLSRPRPGGPDYRDSGLGCYWIGTDPERVKSVVEELLLEAGVELFYHVRACDPLCDGKRVHGVLVEGASGREAILADVVIDCTGDGEIAARAGAEFRIGRDGDGACQPLSMIYVTGPVSEIHLHYDLEKPDPHPDPLVRNRYAGAIARARQRGEIRLNPNDIFCSADPLVPGRPDLARRINFTRIQKRNAADPVDLTWAEIEGRRQAREAVDFQRAYLSGASESQLLFTPAQIGIRESRRILGEHVLTGEEILRGVRFPDAILRGIYLLDIHNPTEVGRPSTLRLLDQPYDIPYRCLIPRGLDGLLTAGRCISGDHTALASYRVQSHCMGLGEAAGTAAALCSRQGCQPRELDPQRLRQALEAGGANTGSGLENPIPAGQKRG